MSTTDTRLSDVLAGREDNYLLPFYWQHGGDQYRKIPGQIARIRESGCRALCVEARPHPEFAGPTWWRDMDLVLATCERLGMKVWILDDKHYPTGYANGEIERHPELRPWLLVERHVDVVGPMPGASVLVPDPIQKEEETFVGAYAFRRRRDRGEGRLDSRRSRRRGSRASTPSSRTRAAPLISQRPSFSSGRLVIRPTERPRPCWRRNSTAGRSMAIVPSTPTASSTPCARSAGT